MKIGYLGPDGTFSQLAAEKVADGTNYEMVAYSSISELAFAANSRVISAAVMPIENSLEGGINTTLDCLAFECDLTITQEVLLSVSQSLLSNSKTITRIYSHPQPIGQCQRYLAKNYPGVPITFTSSTAEAAVIASGEDGAAAIGSEALAEIYGLEIIENGIEDVSTNTTRFVVAKKDAEAVADADKTSIVFGVADKPGALYKMLSVFDIFDINMMKIESRPAKTVLGAYVFFVDINGSSSDENIKKALDIVKYKATFFKLLGSYKGSNQY